MPTNLPEPWLRGPIPGVSAILQPAAHALVAAREEARATTGDLTPEQLWHRLGNSASIGFHLAHLAGSTDRLLTYARGQGLDEDQRVRLASERTVNEARPPLETLLRDWDAAVDAALEQLRSTPDATLVEPRFVGRARLPSTVLGLLFHAAEHASRHSGQITTTALVLRGTDVP